MNDFHHYEDFDEHSEVDDDELDGDAEIESNEWYDMAVDRGQDYGEERECETKVAETNRETQTCSQFDAQRLTLYSVSVRTSRQARRGGKEAIWQ
jgi:hypothetical protein